MPTVFRWGPYRFFFFGNDGSEPPHVHVQRDRALAKIWLRPVALASTTDFRAPMSSDGSCASSKTTRVAWRRHGMA
jgi:uncharacterized protein DUF4160